MYRVLVTGGAGFIGSHLVNRLLDAGYHVTVVDDLSRGRFQNVPKVPNVDYYHCRVQALNTLLGADVVFHLAARVSNIEYNRLHQFTMLQDNLEINTHMSSLVAYFQPRRYFYVSTACVYPHYAPVPTPESAGRVCDPEPTNFGYGAAKWIGEQQARLLSDEHLVDTTVVRFFNAFGWNDYYDWHSSHVAPALIRKTMEHDEIVVWGSGDQTRVLVDAADIARVLIMLLESERIDVLDGTPINIGHRNEISMYNLAKLIRRISGRLDKPIIRDTSKPDGYPRRAADPSRLESIIGKFDWTPFEGTIATMLVDYQRQREAGWVT